MCGIAGIARHAPTGVTAKTLGRMAAAIRHRGPDGYGFYAGAKVGLAHVRLSALDGNGAGQPLTNEDGRIIVTSTCEVFNHPELRVELEQRGHVFRTQCHAEVLVHGYEEWGTDVLQRLDGQFAFAIYDRDRETVFVARDRFGVRPLFYAQRSGDLFFGSEVKAILASGEVDCALDQRGLDEALTLGAARPPRTPFSGIAALEPGTYGIWKDGAFWLRQYYELDYPEAEEEPLDVIEQLDEVMLRSVGMRLRADVPVGAYLSGGMDSSIIAVLARNASGTPFRTFSVTHDSPGCDERVDQREIAKAIGSVHSAAAIGMDTIARSFPSVIWHAETPLLETAPAMMYQLAKVTSEAGIKIVVGGEGADELFLGDEVFKETSVRRFCMRRPESLSRRRLFERVYPQFPEHQRGAAGWSPLFDLVAPGDPLFSHLPRFLSSRIPELYTPEFTAALVGTDVIGELRASLPTRFFAWSALNQAAYLQMTSRLSPYLLGSHGDRMSMAHGVEGRYPFLDHRVFEFAAALPTGSRLRGLKGKEVLRRWASRTLPSGMNRSRKAAHRSPQAQAFIAPSSPAWVSDHMSPESLQRVGIFSSGAVGELIRRCRTTPMATVEENQALVGVLSTQLWHHQFVESALLITPLPASAASVRLGDTIPVSLPNAYGRTTLNQSVPLRRV